MKILTAWLRAYLPSLPVSDRQLAEDLTLRGIAVEGVHQLGPNPDDPSEGHLFEMDITTNRVDAMNHYGIAREAATIYNLPLPSLTDLATNPGAPTFPASPERGGSSSSEMASAPTPFPVRIEAPHLCGRFTAQVLHNITIAPSTGQIKIFFDNLGQKQISNAVDASNFTLLGMGHPTHAFDLDRIECGIVVRLAHKGEKLKLLDGTERTLDPDDLVIADKARALSLAGVMGGWDSMITPETRNILVESAWFDPAAIRRSSRRHNLHTDASHRFERGADFEAAPVANRLVSALILQSGGYAEGPLIDIADPATEQRTAQRPAITLSVKEVQRHLGSTLDDTPTHSALTPALVYRYLTALGCTLTESVSMSQEFPVGAGGFSTLPANPTQMGFSPGPQLETFSVTLPSWRLDLEREIDLIEEIARVHGYNRFSNTLPPPRPVLVHPTHAPEHAVRTRLLALGFSEAISSTFASAPDSHLFAPASAQQGSHVPLENPLSEEAANLRPSLLPGMLTMLAHNLNRDVPTARLFEQGHIFHAEPQIREPLDSTQPQIRVPHLRDSLTVAKVGEAPQNPSPETIEAVQESPSLALGLTTATPQPTALYPAADAPIFELKGAIESLASLFTLPGGPAEALTFTGSPASSLTGVETTANLPAWLEPGRSATAHLGTQTLAHFGELAHTEAARRKLRQPIFLAEIDLAQLYALPLRKVTARELSRFQAAGRDFSFVLPDTVHWRTVAAAIHALALPELQSLTPIEIFRDTKGKAVPTGCHSLLLRTVFQSQTRTLTEEELTAASNRIIEALTHLGGTLRSA